MKTKIISASSDPYKTMAMAARCCYSEYNPLEDPLFSSLKTETEYWDWLCNACIKRGHYSPLEYSQFTFLCLDVPMTTVVQLRTHRSLSMQVQSMRYTSERICNTNLTNEQVFYTRNVGSHARDGSSEIIPLDVQDEYFTSSRAMYTKLVKEVKVPPEVARDILPSCYTQNFVLSCNLRELFHVFGMRTPKDAQLEIRELMDSLRVALLEVIPDAMAWYNLNCWGKFKGSF
jgi:thymidylate synthase (FAD)